MPVLVMHNEKAHSGRYKKRWIMHVDHVAICTSASVRDCTGKWVVGARRSPPPPPLSGDPVQWTLQLDQQLAEVSEENEEYCEHMVVTHLSRFATVQPAGSNQLVTSSGRSHVRPHVRIRSVTSKS
jgi:hypothetical protein